MIRLGEPRQFAAVRAFLERAYNEDSNVLADRVGDFDPARHGDESPLARMFFLGRAVAPQEWERLASPQVRQAFEDLGLIEPASNGRVRCSVLLYKVYGVYTCSDRFTDDEGKVGRPGEDCVYYALTDTAHHYLHSLPKRHYKQALDVGAGSGIAALMLASHADHVYATDIADRCVLFSEFNRQLNGISNVTVRQGSLYEPVQGQTFDLIACHPPFDISLSSKRYVYADGGEDGEFVTRGVISDLPRMLNPGGQFVCAVRVTDRTDGQIEERMRQWMGERNVEFDMAVIVRSIIKPQEHAISASMLAHQNLDDYEQYMDLFKRHGITRMPYVHVLIERKADPARPLTIRRDIGKRCVASEMEALLAWERVRDNVSLTGLRLELSPHVELRVRHKLKSGELAPLDYTFYVEHPFHEEEPVPEWVAKIAALCIGQRTTDEVFALIREEYPIPQSDFEAALKRLISMGVLQPASGSRTISSN